MNLLRRRKIKITHANYRIRLSLVHNQAASHTSIFPTSAVKPEPQLFALAKPESDLNPDSAYNVIQKSKNQKGHDNFLGNSAASNIEKARFRIIFV
jgi:hypothetical protein